jgi:hypothetical protein
MNKSRNTRETLRVKVNSGMKAKSLSSNSGLNLTQRTSSPKF